MDLPLMTCNRHSPQSPSPPQRLLIITPALAAAVNSVLLLSTSTCLLSGKKVTEYLVIFPSRIKVKSINPNGVV
jgi:hypothetical protein